MISLKNLLLGRALANDQLKGEKLSRIWGLPIMASDAVSSVAYAVEEILLGLVPLLGLLAAQYVGYVSLSVILLLVMLIFSYSQIIDHYPNGGGAYVVSKEVFGRRTSQLASACLIVDYTMTVAVSISSSVAAIVAAFPVLVPYKVVISLICISLITLVNLRGIGDSSKIFGIPTYLFIFTMAILILAGFARILMGSLQPPSYSTQDFLPRDTLSGITLLLFLRAFSSGCSALTGVEAVSDATSSFREPTAKTAKHVLYMLGIVSVFIFGGACFLAGALKVIPVPNITVLSQMGRAVFGEGIMFYVFQFSTALILLLAANTSYNGLPVLLSFLAKDKLTPHQFTHRGTKLSFSNGVMFIYIMGALLLLIFRADVHALIPFYAVGVLISFTISQAGMFVKWIRSKEKGWRYKCVINGLGAVVTFVSSIVVFVMKLSGGSWALAIVIPLIMLFMSYTYYHYLRFGKAISADGYDYRYSEGKANGMACVVLIHSMSRGALKTFDYAKEIFADVTVLHISTTKSHTEELVRQWEKLKIDVPLTVIEASFRDVLEPLNQYVTERESNLVFGQKLTVILTKFVGGGLHDQIFHNQTAFFIENKLSRHKNVVTVLVPYIYSLKDGK